MKVDTGNDDEFDLFKIADAINNGLEVDWDTLESSAPKAQRPLVYKLKVIYTECSRILI